MTVAEGLSRYSVATGERHISQTISVMWSCRPLTSSLAMMPE